MAQGTMDLWGWETPGGPMVPGERVRAWLTDSWGWGTPGGPMVPGERVRWWLVDIPALPRGFTPSITWSPFFSSRLKELNAALNNLPCPQPGHSTHIFISTSDWKASACFLTLIRFQIKSLVWFQCLYTSPCGLLKDLKNRKSTNQDLYVDMCIWIHQSVPPYCRKSFSTTTAGIPIMGTCKERIE